MEYRGKEYSVILTIGGNWKWSLGQYRSGMAVSRPAGVKLAERAIDKALAPKKKRLQRPTAGHPAPARPNESDTIPATNHDTELVSKRAWNARLHRFGVELERETCWPPPMWPAHLSLARFFEQA
jgi:hypothetical protein